MTDNVLELLKIGTINALKKAIELDPHNVTLYESIGDEYEKIENYSAALEAYQKITMLNPNHAYRYICGKRVPFYDEYYNSNMNFIYNTIGHIYEKQGNYNKALDSFFKCLNFDEQDTNAYNSIGIVHAKQGDFEQAIKNFIKTIEINPQEYPSAILFLKDWIEDKKLYSKAYWKATALAAQLGNITVKKSLNEVIIVPFRKQIDNTFEKAIIDIGKNKKFKRLDSLSQGVILQSTIMDTYHILKNKDWGFMYEYGITENEIQQVIKEIMQNKMHDYFENY